MNDREEIVQQGGLVPPGEKGFVYYSPRRLAIPLFNNTVRLGRTNREF